MKLKVVLGSIIFGSLSGIAVAADLPSRRAAVLNSPVVAPVFTWSGLYAGLNAGYAFDGDHSYSLRTNNIGLAVPGGLVTGARPASILARSNGFSGGAQVGYNYELGNVVGFGGFVVGVEADAAYSDLRQSYSYVAFNGEQSNFRARTDFVGTVRARLGYAFDNLLVYGTGGFAYGGVSDNLNFLNGVGRSIYAGNRDTLRAGYAYGGGVEYAIPKTSFLNLFKSDAVTVKGEFIRYDLGSSNVLVPNATGVDSGYVAHIHTTGNLVRAGINYKFDAFAAAIPVVARY